jgi:NADH:ubiquinone oxidoreductase subunit K
MFKNKFKASLIHLALSFTLVTLIIASTIFFWYPGDFLGITNYKNIALLIISIDLVLGPVLTFVVFAPKKKSLKFDLAVIAAIQLSALAYGVHALYETHPLFVTYNHKGFNLVQANEVTPSDARYEQFKVSKLASPRLAFAKMPDDPEKQTEIMMGVDLKGEPDIDKRAEYFEPYEKHMDSILKDSLDAVKLFDEKNLTPSTRKFLEKHGEYKNDYAYLPLKGTSGDAIIVLDKKTAQMVGTIAADPWKFAKK